jgi:hypothetical protein
MLAEAPMVAFVLVVEGPLALPKLSLSLPPKELVVVFSVPLLLLQSVVVVEALWIARSDRYRLFPA